MTDRQRALVLRTQKEQVRLLRELKRLKLQRTNVGEQQASNEQQQQSIRAQMKTLIWPTEVIITAGELCRKQQLRSQYSQELLVLHRQAAEFDLERDQLDRALRHLQQRIKNTMDQAESWADGSAT